MDIYQPRVSIGLPIYNGETFLNEALDSVLSQTFSDFELIISDNASTDKTFDICKTYIQKDRRVRYVRNETNKGAAENFNATFRLATGEYFKWMAHDDLIEPEFLEKCVHVLDTNASVVLCNSRIKIIDASGEDMGEFDAPLKRISSSKPRLRFKELILNDVWCFEVFGLIRSEVLRGTQLIGAYIASDRILRVELGLLGRFHEIPEYLSVSRDHPERSVRQMPAHHLRAGWFDPVKEGTRVFPHWRIFIEYFKCIRRVPLRFHERAVCFWYLFLWLMVNMNWARMTADIAIAIQPNLWRPFFRMKGGDDWLRIKKSGERQHK